MIGDAKILHLHIFSRGETETAVRIDHVGSRAPLRPFMWLPFANRQGTADLTDNSVNVQAGFLHLTHTRVGRVECHQAGCDERGSRVL